MFSPATLHPAATFAILAAIFLYLYTIRRRLHFLLWATAWAALVARQAALAAGAEASPSWVAIDVALLVAAGMLAFLGGVAFSGRRRFGLVAAAIVGLAMGTLATLVMTALALFTPAVGAYRAAALGVLIAGWIGNAWFIARHGFREAPVGAPLAGLSLFSWGAWLPIHLVLTTRMGEADWPAEVEAGLGALVAVAMTILGIELSRPRFVGRADARRWLEDDPKMIAVLEGGRVVFANRAFLQRLGRPLDDLRGIDTLELVVPEHREEALVRRAMGESGQPVDDYEIELLDARGGRVPVLVHAVPFVWEGRPALKYELADISPQRWAEEEVRRVNAELLRMNAELERANRLQSEFLSNTTHELKTPLTSIMANTEILEYEMCGPVNDEQRSVLANINRNSQHLLEMISRLLDFARQRAGAAALHVEEVIPREILDGVAETVRPLLEEKELRMDVEADLELGPCWLDGEKVYRVYLNLVENAIKFSPGGTIVVRAAIVDGEFEGSVEDEGIGIPPERLEDIFQAFIQVDASSTRTYPGVGLGLAICRQLVELHGGRIWAESKLGGGSVFRFRLPCAPPALPVATQPVAAEAGEGGGSTER